jgi:hypothetical protein
MFSQTTEGCQLSPDVSVIMKHTIGELEHVVSKNTMAGYLFVYTSGAGSKKLVMSIGH